MAISMQDGYWGSLTEEQARTLVKFKIALARLNADDWHTELGQWDTYDHLRFLRARKFDLQKAVEMFTKYIRWREEVGIENIFRYQFSELSAIKTIYPHGYHKVDKLGRPIYIERIGIAKFEEVLQTTTKERFIRYYIREYEKQRAYIFPACSQAASKHIETCLTILDLFGGSSVLLTERCYSLVRLASRICQDYYPETLGIMFIVNCSFLLRVGWFVIRGFIDAKTCSKIHILGDAYQEELFEFVDPANLPEFLSGTCRCDPHGCLNQTEGPWKPWYEQFPNLDNVSSESQPAYDAPLPLSPPKWKLTLPLDGQNHS